MNWESSLGTGPTKRIRQILQFGSSHSTRVQMLNKKVITIKSDKCYNNREMHIYLGKELISDWSGFQEEEMHVLSLKEFEIFG